MRPVSLFKLLLAVASSFSAAPGVLAYPCGSILASVSESFSGYCTTGSGADGDAHHEQQNVLSVSDEGASGVLRDEEDSRDTIYKILKAKQGYTRIVREIDAVPVIRDLLDGGGQWTFLAPTDEAMSRVNNLHWNESRGSERDKSILETFYYHIIPGVVDSGSLGRNSTIGTSALAGDGSFGGVNRRIKVTRGSVPPWKIKLNDYISVTEPDMYAKNGIIQGVDELVLMPPDIMDLAFTVPSKFSISSMAFLKTNLQGQFEFNSLYKKDGQTQPGYYSDRHGYGTSMTTLFLPTNDAWNKLPPDLTLWLFSPAGERTLRKVLAWHTIPDTAVFSELIHHIHSNHSRTDIDARKKDSSEEDLSFEWDRQFPSLIKDRHMPVHVKKSKSKLPGSHTYTVELQAHGVSASIVDNPAQNGVVHVVPQVLSPRSSESVDEERNAKDWEEWKEWLIEYVHVLASTS